MAVDVGILGGIGLGLAAAAGQSVSYFCSKLFVIRRGNAVLRLVVLGHLIMGGISLAVLPLLWRPVAPELSVIAWPVIRASLFYLLGQAAFFLALRYDDASRLSPLLGLKIIVLAVLYLIWPVVHLTWIHWAGAGVSVVAAMMLNYAGQRIAPAAAISVLLACVFYSLSDWNIAATVDVTLRYTDSRLMATLLSVSLSYVLCGAVALSLLPVAGVSSLREWHYALPFALSWLTAMVFLFACFNTIGVLYGNLVQATRGVMTVVMAAAVAKMGFVRIEPVVGRSVFLRRLAAAMLMFLAIGLYYLSGFKKV